MVPWSVDRTVLDRMYVIRPVAASEDSYLGFLEQIGVRRGHPRRQARHLPVRGALDTLQEGMWNR